MPEDDFFQSSPHGDSSSDDLRRRIDELERRLEQIERDQRPEEAEKPQQSEYEVFGAKPGTAAIGIDAPRFSARPGAAAIDPNSEQQDKPASAADQPFGNRQLPEHAPLQPFTAETDAPKESAVLGTDPNVLGHSYDLNRLRREVDILWRRLKEVFGVGGSVAQNCLTTGATTIGAASEGAEAASSTTWSRDSDQTPLDWWTVSRIGYFESGDSTLYAYMRKLSLDSCGKGFNLSAETRVTIDVPEDCAAASTIDGGTY